MAIVIVTLVAVLAIAMVITATAVAMNSNMDTDINMDVDMDMIVATVRAMNMVTVIDGTGVMGTAMSGAANTFRAFATATLRLVTINEHIPQVCLCVLCFRWVHLHKHCILLFSRFLKLSVKP